MMLCELEFDVESSAEPTLIAGRLARRERTARSPGSPEEKAACLAAIREGRDPTERAIDFVVERLLDELSW